MKRKIIIVGGGVAGLTAGIYAQKAGFESEIYEKNDCTGGLCNGWMRDGHYIDNCIRWLTGTEEGTQLRRLWEEIGALSGDSVFVADEVFYASSFQGKTVALWKDIDRTEKELCKLSPQDEAEVHNFIEAVKLAQCRKMPVEKPMDLMTPPELIQLGKSMQGMKKVAKEYGEITLRDYAKRFQSQVIRKLLTDFYMEESVVTSLIFAYASVTCQNGEIPAGGSRKMVNRITNRYKELGGKVFLNHPVQKVNIEHDKAKGIELKNGFTVEGDYIVCATDTYESLYHLIGKSYVPKEWDAVYNERSEHPVSSKFQIALSVEEECCPVVGTLFCDCEKIKVATSDIERLCLIGYGYEPQFAPEGRTVLQLKVEQTEIDFNYWSFFSQSMYEKKKREYADLVLEQLEKQFPALQGRYKILDIWTPRTYWETCNAFQGAFMRYKTKAGVKKMASNGMLKQVSNLYLASQWMQEPGGLPTAAAAGKFAIQHILRRERKYVSF